MVFLQVNKKPLIDKASHHSMIKKALLISAFFVGFIELKKVIPWYLLR